jgi:CheY-like chemotaxis protein
MVADDDVGNRTATSLMLEAAGYQVVEAEDGVQAVAVAESRALSAVLMDISMPKMDGIEARSRIHHRHPALPIIALTANVMPADRAVIEAAGFAGYISKPVHYGELTGTLSRHLVGAAT